MRESELPKWEERVKGKKVIALDARGKGRENLAPIRKCRGDTSGAEETPQVAVSKAAWQDAQGKEELGAALGAFQREIVRQIRRRVFSERSAGFRRDTGGKKSRPPAPVDGRVGPKEAGRGPASTKKRPPKLKQGGGIYLGEEEGN